MSKTRFLVGLPFALVVTIGLFFLMQYLVAARGLKAEEPGEIASIEFGRDIVDTPPETEKYDPKRPEPVEDPPKIDLPDSEVSRDNDGVFVDWGPGEVVTEGFVNTSGAFPIPMATFPPPYPSRAAEKGIEGFVTVEFTVTDTGSVEDVVVIDSDPPGYFEKTVIKTVKKWKYRPGDRAQRMQTRLTFELKDD